MNIDIDHGLAKRLETLVAGWNERAKAGLPGYGETSLSDAANLAIRQLLLREDHRFLIEQERRQARALLTALQERGVEACVIDWPSRQGIRIGGAAIDLFVSEPEQRRQADDIVNELDGELAVYVYCPESLPHRLKQCWSLSGLRTLGVEAQGTGAGHCVRLSPAVYRRGSVKPRPRARLFAEGRSPFWLTRYLNGVMAGEILYSDAVQDDTNWVDRLYSATGIARAFDIQPADVLWHAQGWTHSEPLNACKAQARSAAGGQHRAAADVRYLYELWKLLAKGSLDK